MQFINTKSFKLSTYVKGSPDSDKLALVLPGRLDTKDYPHMTSLVDYLSEHGCYAVSFDPPGTWGSPGGIELYTMTNYLKAINELIAHFGRKPTILAGHSRGGGMAMLAGTTIDEVTHFIAVMSNPSASVLVDESQGKKISYRDLPPDDYVNKKKFELPLSYFKDAARYNMRKDLENCTKPKLFIYGTEDKLISEEKVTEYFEAAAEPKRLVGVKSEHDYRKYPKIIQQVNEVIGKFLDDYS